MAYPSVHLIPVLDVSWVLLS